MTPAGFFYVPCHIFIHSLPCCIRRIKHGKDSIHQAATAMREKLVARGIRIVHCNIDDRKAEAEIWCDASIIQR